MTSLFAGVAAAQVTVKVHPVRAPLTLTQPQQFTAAVSGTTNHSVIWSVDGVTGGNSTVGTITTGGLYKPPSSAGTHTVSARSAVSTAKGSATVWVTNYPGMQTYHADKYRSGVNAQERALSSSNVNQNTFGRVFRRTVDGQVYAQPLIVNNLTIAGAKHNVVYVATEHGSVYAFDADGKTSTPFWHKSFVNPSAGVTSIPKSSNALVSPEVSITGTPAIDLSTSTMYVAVSTDENGKFVHRLHALSLTSGAEKFGGPIVIQGSVPGTYSGSTTVSFSPQQQMQRAALLLLNGVVYVAFGSWGDQLPYNGWLFAYTANSTGVLHRAAIFCTSPDKGESAIWQSGAGPAADGSGYIYVSVANGQFDLNTGGHDAGDTVLKLQLQSGNIAIIDYFTPANETNLNANDLDVGSGGPVVVPTQSGAAAPSLLAVGDKNGSLYIINRQNMGHYNASTNSNLQTLTVSSAAPTGGEFGVPAVYGSSLYLGENGKPLRLYTFTNGVLSSTPTASSSHIFYYSGAEPMLSTNNGGNKIVWALDVSKFIGGGHTTTGPAVLYAFNASNLQLLYSSSQAGSRDTAGTAIKFTSPTISNGRVYVGTASELDVYGFLP